MSQNHHVRWDSNLSALFINKRNLKISESDIDLFTCYTSFFPYIHINEAMRLNEHVLQIALKEIGNLGVNPFVLFLIAQIAGG